MIRNVSGNREEVPYQASQHVVVFENDLTENYDTHWHIPIEILMPLEGDYDSVVNDKIYHVHPGEILFINSGSLHRHRAPATGKRLFFLIDASIVSQIDGLQTIFRILGQSMLFSESTTPDIHAQLKQLLNDIRDIYFYSGSGMDIPQAMRRDGKTYMGKNSFQEIRIYSKVLEMMGIIGSHYIDNLQMPSENTHTQQRYISSFMNICSYIDNHFMEDLYLEDIAGQAGFSKYHFERLFKNFTGLPFYKYVNQKRIDYAIKQLADDSRTVTDIAVGAGFTTPSAFIRMFKQTTGCTPTEFRQKSRQKD